MFINICFEVCLYVYKNVYLPVYQLIYGSEVCLNIFLLINNVMIICYYLLFVIYCRLEMDKNPLQYISRNIKLILNFITRKPLDNFNE